MRRGDAGGRGRRATADGRRPRWRWRQRTSAGGPRSPRVGNGRSRRGFARPGRARFPASVGNLGGPTHDTPLARGDNLERSHHLVGRVLEQVAVPKVAAREGLEPNQETSDDAGIGAHGVPSQPASSGPGGTGLPSVIIFPWLRNVSASNGNAFRGSESARDECESGGCRLGEIHEASQTSTDPSAGFSCDRDRASAMH